MKVGSRESFGFARKDVSAIAERHTDLESQSRLIAIQLCASRATLSLYYPLRV